jgi:hypothetical protein
LTIAKLKNEKFNDLLHINNLIAVVRKNVYTDLSPQEMLSLAWAFSNFDMKKLDTEQVPFVGDKVLACCGDVLIADDQGKAALVHKLFPPPSQAEPDVRLVNAVDPARVHVVVENGSGVAGQGAKVAAALRKLGFVVDSVGNASSFGYDATEIHQHSTAAPLAAQRVRAALALKSSTVQADPPSIAAASAGDVTVIVGRDLAVASATPTP